MVCIGTRIVTGRAGNQGNFCGKAACPPQLAGLYLGKDGRWVVHGRSYGRWFSISILCYNSSAVLQLKGVGAGGRGGFFESAWISISGFSGGGNCIAERRSFACLGGPSIRLERHPVCTKYLTLNAGPCLTDDVLHITFHRVIRPVVRAFLWYGLVIRIIIIIVTKIG